MSANHLSVVDGSHDPAASPGIEIYRGYGRITGERIVQVQAADR